MMPNLELIINIFRTLTKPKCLGLCGLFKGTLGLLLRLLVHLVLHCPNQVPKDVCSYTFGTIFKTFMHTNDILIECVAHYIFIATLMTYGDGLINICVFVFFNGDLVGPLYCL